MARLAKRRTSGPGARLPKLKLCFKFLETASDAKMIKLVYDFCKANPDKKPISAIDKFIRGANRIEVKESEVFDA